MKNSLFKSSTNVTYSFKETQSTRKIHAKIKTKTFVFITRYHWVGTMPLWTESYVRVHTLLTKTIRNFQFLSFRSYENCTLFRFLVSTEKWLGTNYIVNKDMGNLHICGCEMFLFYMVHLSYKQHMEDVEK